MTLGLHCLAFQEMLREGFTCPNESPQVTVSKLLLAFCISLSSNTENPGRKHHSRFAHFHLHFLFRTEKRGSEKNRTKVSVCKQSSFAPVLRVYMCLRAYVCVLTTLQLETHCWISPERGKSLDKSISIRHIGIMLPVIWLTSFFFFCQSLHAQPSVMLVGRTTCSEQGGLLPGRGSGVRPKGRNKHGNFLT